jgi:hypothetical protein
MVMQYNEQRLEFLEESKHSHFRVAEKVWHSSHSQPLKLLASSVLKRSVSLVFGFTSLIRERNFICAASLIRLQLDNLLRFRAAFMVANPDQFVVDVISGKEVRNLVNRNGEKMTDAFLQRALASEYPWLQHLYKATSGYIHFSEQHFLNTMKITGHEEDIARFQAYIGPDDKFVDSEAYDGAIEDMISTTHALLDFLAHWVTKC